MVRQAPQRDFDEDMPSPEEAGPKFRLGGEEFHCLACPPGGVMPKIMAASRVDDRGKRQFNAPDIAVFIEDVLCEEMLVADAPSSNGDGDGHAEGEVVALREAVMVMQPVDDVERWRVLMADKKRPVPIERMGAIMFWLIEIYTNRPTQPSRR